MSISRTYNKPTRSNTRPIRISPKTEERVLRTAEKGPEAVDRRLRELDNEWDVVSLLKLHAVTIGLKYILFTSIVSKKYMWVPAVVGAMYAEQTSRGWSPPYALFKKLGWRTKEEIDEERYALKYLRGDFD
jgi:hypothetical protein